MKVLAMLVAVSLLLMPCSIVRAQTSNGSAPPIGQPLVREGDFAVKLAQTFNLTASDDEAAAESSLVSAGIYPRNGWISDYPVTPDILAEVQESAGAAADSGQVSLPRSEAVRLVGNVSTDLGLPIALAEGQNVTHAGTPYEDPSVVQSYYDEYGPPVVSYYPPPDDYWYLYSYVPWPFWWDTWGFGGFFVLNHFDRVVHHRHGHGFRHFSNTVRGTNGTFARIDPATRSATSTSFAAGNRSSWSASSAGAIVSHDMDRFQGNRTGLNQNAVTTGSVHSGSVNSFAGTRSGNVNNFTATAPTQIHPSTGGATFGAGTIHSGGTGFHGSAGTFNAGSGAFHGGASTFHSASGGFHASGGGFHASSGGFHGGGGGGFHGGGGGFHGGGGGHR